MRPGSDKTLARAISALRRAEAHAASGSAERAVERAYHAIMHAARVVLNEAGERAHSHVAIGDKLDQLALADLASLREAVAQALAWGDELEALAPDDAERIVMLARAAVEDVCALVGSPS